MSVAMSLNRLSCPPMPRAKSPAANAKAKISKEPSPPAVTVWPLPEDHGRPVAYQAAHPVQDSPEHRQQQARVACNYSAALHREMIRPTSIPDV